MRKTSPKLKVEFGTIAAGETKIYDAYNKTASEFPASKYAPWNTLYIQNLSSVIVNISLDDKFTFQVRSNSMFIIEKDDGIQFSRIKIENIDASSSVNDNELYIYLQYVRPNLLDRW